MTYLEERLGVAGKVAVIVGGGGGLGRASAEELGRAGMRLAICDRNEVLLEETAERIRAAGGTVFATVLDARLPEALEQFFMEVDRAYANELDVLVNVVGGTFHQPFADSKPSGWQALIRANFTWVLHSSHLAIPRLRHTGRGGSIINFSSVEGHRAAPGVAVYSGMKWALEGFTRTLAVELGPDGIRVNTIAPDMTPTEGMGQTRGAGEWNRYDGSPASQMTARIGIPAGRYGSYEEIGGCVLFLASDLSRYVTGSSLHPDGGTLASSGWFNWPGRGYDQMPPIEVADLFVQQEGSGQSR